MAHPNSADRVHSQLFSGVADPGNLSDSFLSLVIQLVSSRDAVETAGENPVVELDRQLTALHGSSLAVQYFRSRTNSLREQYSR